MRPPPIVGDAETRFIHLLLAGFALSMLAGCPEPYLGVKIPFTASWGGERIGCDDAEVALSDLRFYLSSIQLLDARGRAVDLALQADVPSQQPDLALIDLENGQGPCSSGSAEAFPFVVGAVPPGDYQALRFTVGVPFERNHANPLTAQAPLDDAAMHWHWRSGYKFMRAGVKSIDDGFWLHIGSAGCEGTARNVTGCRFPNRAIVEIAGFVPNVDTVALDLKVLFDSVDLGDGTPGDCSSGPGQAACIAPFAALGIDFESGETTGRQRVFSLRR